ncbi:hypothetical protein B0H16DRAFT_1393372 [Mycena metata]|uniref:BTB domain-containing protein n=1 Tax=Mycena metata TaxID=1033252 RepID=A0AAD7GXA8_9AGAR|nr:hypothetical protein B0H16DRAFT_1393372 [Mycena metata]
MNTAATPTEVDTAPVNAPFPYDDKAQADLILQTSDNFNFFVYKLLLSLVSPVFKDMFTLPQPVSHTLPDSHPVIPVEENSDTLNRLLSWCDPRVSPITGTLEEIQVVLEVADKYCMESVTKRVGEMLAFGVNDLCPAGSGSVRLYAIGIRYSMATLAHKAARCSLAAKWEDLMAEDVPELAYIPGSALHRLQRYRLACGAAAKKVALDWNWVALTAPGAATGVVSECVLCANGVPPRHWSKWWVQYMDVAAEELYRNPSGSTVTPELAMVSLSHLGSCQDCGRTVGETYRALVKFNKAFVKEIERVVDEVLFLRFHVFVLDLDLLQVPAVAMT